MKGKVFKAIGQKKGSGDIKVLILAATVATTPFHLAIDSESNAVLLQYSGAS
jgi:hypothetical protein